MKQERIFNFISAVMILGACSFTLWTTGCKDTQTPLGLNAPLGFDRPTLTPTPQVGAVDVYISDTGIAIQGVTVDLLDPSGNTVSVSTTQPVVGFAAFNPPTLNSGTWHAVVPAQSVSYVTTGPATIKHTYWNSTIPIVVSGGGSYSATFTTGNNTVSVSPVTATMALANPDYIPVTVSYSENGTLDVPVSVTLSGYPLIPGFTLSSNPSFVFGGGNNLAPVSIIKNTCYYQSFPLSVSAYDFSGNPVAYVGGEVVKGWTIPVTCLICKHSLGSGYEEVLFQAADAATSLSCGASVYSVSYQLQAGVDPPGGTVHVNNFPANTASASVSYTGGSDPYVRATFTIPNGQQFVYDIQVQYLAFDSYSTVGNSSW